MNKIKQLAIVALCIFGAMACGTKSEIVGFNPSGYDDTDILNRLDLIEAELEEVNEILQNTINVIELCEPGNEVLLKLRDGSHVAYFQNGTKRYLSVLDEGLWYITTDIKQCKFIIDDGEVYYE